MPNEIMDLTDAITTSEPGAMSSKRLHDVAFAGESEAIDISDSEDKGIEVIEISD